MNTSYDWYRIFYDTARSGSVTAAARQLYISQPAVSQCIRQLENALGCALFIRTPRGVALTSEGQTFYQYVSKGIEQLQLGEKRLASLLSLESGEIHIGASDMTLEFYLLPRLEDFHKRYPGIRIGVTNGPTPETLRKLEDGLIDFGVVTEPINAIGAANAVADSGISSVPVREIEDIFICGSDYPAAPDRTVSLAELAALPLIMLEPNTSSRSFVDAFLTQNGVRVLPEFELATSSLIVQFAERNLGIGCVVRDFARQALENNRVFELKPDKPLPKRHICVVRKDALVSKASEKLLELLLA